MSRSPVWSKHGRICRDCRRTSGLLIIDRMGKDIAALIDTNTVGRIKIQVEKEPKFQISHDHRTDLTAALTQRYGLGQQTLLLKSFERRFFGDLYEYVTSAFLERGSCRIAVTVKSLSTSLGACVPPRRTEKISASGILHLESSSFPSSTEGSTTKKFCIIREPEVS